MALKRILRSALWTCHIEQTGLRLPRDLLGLSCTIVEGDAVEGVAGQEETGILRHRGLDALHAVQVAEHVLRNRSRVTDEAREDRFARHTHGEAKLGVHRLQ